MEPALTGPRPRNGAAADPGIDEDLAEPLAVLAFPRRRAVEHVLRRHLQAVPDRPLAKLGEQVAENAAATG